MNNLRLCLLLMCLSAFQLSGQRINPFIDLLGFEGFHNPAQLSLHEKNTQLNFTAAIRRHSKIKFDKYNHIFFGGRYETPLFLGYHSLTSNLQFNRTSFGGATFINTQAGFAFHLRNFSPNTKDTKKVHFDFSAGFQFGLGQWTLADIPMLRPWNLGDPLLELVDVQPGTFFLGGGGFGQIIINNWLSPNQSLGLFAGIAIPYTHFCGKKDSPCYQFSNNGFSLNSAAGDQKSLLHFQLGAFFQGKDDLKYRLNLYSRPSFAASYLYGGNFLFSIPLEKDPETSRYLAIQSSFNTAKTFQFHIGLNFAIGNSKMLIAFQFGYIITNNQFALPDAQDIILNFTVEEN